MGISTERRSVYGTPSASQKTVLIIRFNNKVPMFTGPTHCGVLKTVEAKQPHGTTRTSLTTTTASTVPSRNVGDL